jgi:hypothetical protein
LRRNWIRLARFSRAFSRESPCGFTIMLNKGDVLLLYTDGVSEAMDASRKRYSEKRLACKLRELTNRRAKEIAQLILADVQKFNAKSKYVVPVQIRQCTFSYSGTSYSHEL